jgi:pantothenate kinase
MLVGDIYGTDYNKIGLKATTIASSMGKVFRKPLSKAYNHADVARSLLFMIRQVILDSYRLPSNTHLAIVTISVRLPI